MNVPETPFKLFWIAWILIFVVVEYVAIKRVGHGDTFSEFVWWVMGTGDNNRDALRWIARAVVLGGLVWLIPHFASGWTWFKS